MCTAATYKTRDFYFGRTLDYEISYGEEVVITPRKYSFNFRFMGEMPEHYAVVGMAHVEDGYPLYYDAANEAGLAMAGLNFVGNAVYGKPEEDCDNVAVFEFIPWILSQCATVNEACELLKRINLVDSPFSPSLPSAQLHWMIADRNLAVTVECTDAGLHVYRNAVGVLTNNPPFDMQLFNLSNYMGLSRKNPENSFSGELELKAYSRGMGAIGLPGDLSSQSRFVRAAFTRQNSVSGDSEEESVGQFFHILGTVEQVRGCCETPLGFELTQYTSCCNVDKGIYYYTTYGSRRINAVRLRSENLDGKKLTVFPLPQGESINYQN